MEPSRNRVLWSDAMRVVVMYRYCLFVMLSHPHETGCSAEARQRSYPHGNQLPS
jgi:hypothetical protein